MAETGAIAAQLLRRRALLLVPRLLGLCDRRPDSPTLGCFDRYYWNYKLHDVANARFQEAVLMLHLALPHLSAGCRPGVEACLRAGLSFWAERRHRDGSVDEVYPYERSFCATSMSAQAITAVWLRLHTEPEGQGSASLPAIDFTSTAAWLAQHDNPEVANQMAGACAALARFARLLDSGIHVAAAADKLQRIIAHQRPDGCFDEYGGPDIGYATITLALLAGYHRETGSAAALESMQRCAAYLERVVDAQGLYDWRTTSRRTQFLYPSGLAYLGSPVLDRLLTGLERGVAIDPLWMDDRYCIPLAADYFLAAEYIEAGTSP